MDTKDKIRDLYTKMNYEYTKELVDSHLSSLFSLWDYKELEEIYKNSQARLDRIKELQNKERDEYEQEELESISL